MRCTPARVTQKDFLFAFNNDAYFRVKGTSFYFSEKGMPKRAKSVSLSLYQPRSQVILGKRLSLYLNTRVFRYSVPCLINIKKIIILF